MKPIRVEQSTSGIDEGSSVSLRFVGVAAGDGRRGLGWILGGVSLPAHPAESRKGPHAWMIDSPSLQQRAILVALPVDDALALVANRLGAPT